MKITDNKGHVFDSVEVARDSYCMNMDQGFCNQCPISSYNNGTKMNCGVYCEYHPDEAVNKMGYTIIKKEKSRIHEIFGVEPDEVFGIFGYPEKNYDAVTIGYDGIPRKIGGGVLSHNVICWVINHPESVIHYHGDLTLEEVHNLCAKLGGVCSSCIFRRNNTDCELMQPPRKWRIP